MTILANRLIRGSITQKNSKIVLGVWFWMLRSFHLQDFYLSLPFTIFCSSTGGFFSVSAINIVSSAYLMMLHLRLLIMNVRLLIFSGSPHCKGWGFKANPKVFHSVKSWQFSIADVILARTNLSVNFGMRLRLSYCFKWVPPLFWLKFSIPKV